MTRLIPFLLAMLIASPSFGATEIIRHDLLVDLDPKARHVAIADRITVEGSGDAIFRLNAVFGTPRITEGEGRLSPVNDDGAGGTRRWRLTGWGSTRSTITLSYEATLPDMPDPRDVQFRRALMEIPIHASERGTFFPEESDWVPMVDQETGFRYAVQITTPQGQEAIVPGERLLRKVSDGKVVTQYEASWPAQGITLMAGPYEIREAKAGDIHLYAYLHAEVAGVADEYLDAVRGYIDFYAKQIGPYPFKQFSVVSSPLPTGFGFPTLTLLGVDVIRLPFIKTTSLGHEVLHNWWGNGVAPDYATGNWSEALTTYMADYHYKEEQGEAAAREMRLEWLRDYASYVRRSDDIPLRRFTVRTESRLRAIGYNKGAFVFHMLRREIGDPAFYEGLQLFYRKHLFKTASWGDLRKAFEKTSGRRLAPFFEQWVERIGSPEIVLVGAGIKAEIGAPAATATRHAVTMTLGQLSPPFTLNLPVRITTETGTEERVIQFSESKQSFTLVTDAAPWEVQIDPDAEVFRAPDPGEMPPVLSRVQGDPAAEVWIPPSSDPKSIEALSAVATDLFGTSKELRPAAGRLPSNHAIVLLGTTDRLQPLASQLLRDVVNPVVERVQNWDVRVTAMRTAAGDPVLVIEGKTLEALSAVSSKLPHYSVYSYLAFEGGRNVEKGIWPTRQEVLRKILSGTDLRGARMRGVVEALSAVKFEGRRTGTEGGRRASQWVEREMQTAGLRPAGTRGWRAPFTFEVRSLGKGNSLQIGGRPVAQGEWLPWIWSGTERAEGPLRPLGSAGRGEIWVERLPEPPSASGMIATARSAEEDGAKALLIAVPADRVANSLSVWPGHFPEETLARWMRRKTLTGPEFFDMQSVALQSRAARPDPPVRIPVAFVREDRIVVATRADLRVAIDARTVKGANIVGIAGPAGEPPVLAVGAHYDHLGVYADGTVFPGADDNASGVAVLLEAARSVAETPPARPVLFVAFDAEEWGLQGSTALANHPPVPLGKLAAVLILDAVGRNETDQLHAVGASRSPDLFAEAVFAARDSRLRLLPDIEFAFPYGSDHYPFYLKGIPSLDFTSSYHADFHRPTDTPEKVDVGKLERVADTVTRLTRRFAGRDAPELIPPIPADVPFPTRTAPTGSGESR